jgi:hypothetical protein
MAQSTALPTTRATRMVTARRFIGHLTEAWSAGAWKAILR